MNLTSPPDPAAEALARISDKQAQAARAGVSLREPPPVPTTCCGRGCNGCVWEGYFAAVGWWLEDAHALLGLASMPSSGDARRA